MTTRILLVDDTPTVRYKYEVLLRREGYEVDSSADGREALARLAERTDYDLVVSDLKMPGMDGNQLLEAIRTDSRHALLPVLMLTGSDDEQDVVDNLGAGASDYVLKSCTPRVLLARVKNLVAMKRLQDEVRIARDTDSLTRLSSRLFGATRLEEELGRARRYGRTLSVALIDIDHFKRVNDTLGHQGGDEVLVAVAAQLRRATRASDFTARWGGEEFLMVFPETEGIDAAAIVERLRREIETARVSVGPDANRRDVSVTVSGGVAELRDGDSLEALVNRADAALYGAKEQGRNRLLRSTSGELVPV